MSLGSSMLKELVTVCGCVVACACQGSNSAPAPGGASVESVPSVPKEETRFSATTREQRRRLAWRCSDDPCFQALIAAATDSGERKELVRVRVEHERLVEQFLEDEDRMAREVR